MEHSTNMTEEVYTAALFITSILKQSNKISEKALAKFFNQLREDLEYRYQNHWYPEEPEKGSGYRCIRNSAKGVDPRIRDAGLACGISKSVLAEAMPSAFVLWVDPQDVSYCMGYCAGYCVNCVDLRCCEEECPAITKLTDEETEKCRLSS